MRNGRVTVRPDVTGDLPGGVARFVNNLRLVLQGSELALDVDVSVLRDIVAIRLHVEAGRYSRFVDVEITFDHICEFGSRLEPLDMLVANLEREGKLRFLLFGGSVS